MKWFSSQINTFDGETLEIILPTEIKCWELIIDAYGLSYYTIELDNIKLENINTIYIQHTLKDAINFSIHNLNATIRWIRDDRKAPPRNHKIYESKCVKALDELFIKYSDKNPELFI